MKRLITPDFTARAAALRAQGLTLTEVGEQLGCTRSTVTNALGPTGRHLNGGKRRFHAPRKLDYDQTRKVVERRNQGVPVIELARIYGVNPQTIYRSIRRLEQ